VIDRLLLVQKYWRLRATFLAKGGWTKITQHEDPMRALWYARNCLPVTALVAGEPTHGCDHSRVCPFCWGREIALRGFSAIENLCYGGPVLYSPPAPEGVHLTAFRTLRRHGVGEAISAEAWAAIVSELAAPDGWIRTMVSNREARSAEVKVLRARAAFMTHRITFDSEQQQLWVERCGLALTTEKPESRGYIKRLKGVLGKLAPKRGSDFKLRYLGKPTREAIFQGVVWALPYPRQMMFGKVTESVALLNGLALEPKVRLTSCFGPRSQKVFFESLGLEVPDAATHEEDAS
jgi:hypothetical protein